MQKVDQYLTVAQVVSDLGICRGTAWRWIQAGTLPAIRIGRNYKIPIEPYLKIRASLVHCEDPTAPKIQTLIDEWTQHLLNGPTPYSPKTAKDYAYNLHKYLKLIDGAVTVTQAITRDNAIKAIEAIPIKSYSVRCHVINSVTCFAKFLVNKGLLGSSIIDELKSVRPKRFYPLRKTVLEPEQIPEFLAAIWAASGNSCYQRKLNYAIIKTFLLTGLRNSELCNLMLSDVDLKNRVLTVRFGKGRKFRLLGINQELAKILEEYISIRPKTDIDALFVTHFGNKLRPNYVIYRLNRLSKATGIDVTAHGLRRTFVTQSALKGHSLAVISKAAGHSDLKTTQGYLLVAEKHVVAEMKDW